MDAGWWCTVMACNSEAGWKSWRARAEAQISTIQTSVLAEAEQNAAREAELSKATAAAGDAMIEQQQCKEEASRLKEENRQLRRELKATATTTASDASGSRAAVEKEKSQNMKLRSALESLMNKHKQVAQELLERKEETKELKRAMENAPTAFEVAELREQLAGQHEQIGTVDALQSMLQSLQVMPRFFVESLPCARICPAFEVARMCTATPK